MFSQEFEAAAVAAEGKLSYLKKNPAGYIILSMLAGAFIGFGVLLTNTIGAQLSGAGYTKLIMGITFSAGLSLVVIAGAELFTGNNMVMAAGLMKKKVRIGETLLLWLVCWLGNLAGSFLLGGLFVLTGLPKGNLGEFMAAAAVGKAALSPVELLARGALCNMLVCLAIWCGFRAKSEAGKLVMILWCILAFITTGFEHSIANMTLFSEVLLNPMGQGLTFTGAVYNVLLVTAGNMIGGIVFVAVPYFLAGREK